MSKRFNVWLLILAAIMVSRFIGMALFPFADTKKMTETLHVKAV